MEDLYVGLKMKLLDRNGRTTHGDARKKKILFESFKRTNVTPRTVLVIGGAGFGKTTLCRKMAYDWAGQGKTFPEFSSDEAVILYLDMSRLRKGANLEEELLKLAMQEESVEAMSDTSETLKSYDRNVIVVLDGYVGICEELQSQIRDLTKSRRNSVFKAASIVVTSRPGLDEKTMLLFHKHFILKGFSIGLAQKLVFNYFKRSSSLLGTYYQNALDQFQMKNMSPLVILAMCGCELRMDSHLDRYDTFRQLAVRLGNLCNTRDGLGLTSEQVEDQLDRLGLFFWNCLCKKKHSFNRSDLDLGLKDDCEFILSSGLLRTKEDFDTWEPMNTVLMESIARHHLERHWLSCWASENIHSFLTSFFPKLPSLQVCCCTSTNLTNNEVRFRVTFEYKEFRMCFTISESESKFFLLDRSHLSNNSGDDNRLSISYHLLLRNKEDSLAIVHNLSRMFRNGKALRCLAQFISAAKFAKLHLTFSLPSNASTMTCFSKELQGYVVSDETATHPLSVFRTLCQELHVTFENSACTSLFVRSVLDCILEIQSNSLKFDSEYHIVEGLRATIVEPPFAASYIYGSKTLYYSSSKCARVRTVSQLKELCDRLDLIFGTNENLANTTEPFL